MRPPDPPPQEAPADASGSPLCRNGHQLTLLVQETEPGVYRFQLDAADRSRGPNNERYGPFRLRRDPRKFVGAFFAGLADLPAGTPEIAQRQLESRGIHLFRELFPVELRRRLWSLRDSTQTLQIQSDEPWIPWELCKLEGEDGQSGPFLCEAFAVTRFLPHYPQPTRLPLHRIAAVVAAGDLPQARAEFTELSQLAKNGRRVDPLPADYLKIVEALTAGHHDGWHFVGHGQFDRVDPNQSAVLLDGYQKLTPEDLSPAGDFGKRQPLVFWNACSTGRADYALTGVGGWAKAFLEAGAGAFIGTHWPIPNAPAKRFALAFYRHFFAGAPLAEAVRAARQEIRTTGDPTWLAYTVYANPAARCLASEEIPPSWAPPTPRRPADPPADEVPPTNVKDPRAVASWAAATWSLSLLGGLGSGIQLQLLWRLLSQSDTRQATLPIYLLLIAIPLIFRASSLCDQRLRDHLKESLRHLALILTYLTGILAGLYLLS